LLEKLASSSRQLCKAQKEKQAGTCRYLSQSPKPGATIKAAFSLSTWGVGWKAVNDNSEQANMVPFCRK
jgi:hypothetical protein